MKKLALTLIICSMLSGSTFGPAVFAAEITGSDTKSISNCFYRGGKEFVSFLSATLGASTGMDFVEGLYQPWLDVFARNACHAYDILALLNEEAKVRSTIRNAYMTCRTDNMDRLLLAYNKISAEIYYVRHKVDPGLAWSVPFYGSLQNFGIVDDDILIPKMRELYLEDSSGNIGGKFSSDEFNLFYRDLTEKYAEKFDPNNGEYVAQCEGSWAEVKEKWDEFYAFFIEGGAINKLEKDYNKTIGSSVEALKKEGEVFTSKEGWSNFALSKFQAGLKFGDAPGVSLMGNFDGGAFSLDGGDTTGWSSEDSGWDEFSSDSQAIRAYNQASNTFSWWDAAYNPGDSANSNLIVERFEAVGKSDELSTMISKYTNLTAKVDTIYRSSSKTVMLDILEQLDGWDKAIRASLPILNEVSETCGKKVADRADK
ncbi:hypothetical protein KJ632_00655 [Patescibacteria group bacterium]|nr:hypothetical protein [Patescibacteria group bacterium]